VQTGWSRIDARQVSLVVRTLQFPPESVCDLFEVMMANNDTKPCSDAITEEMKKFQGTWRQIAYKRDGVTEPVDEQGWGPRVTFTGDAFVVTLADGSIRSRGLTSSTRPGNLRPSTGQIRSAMTLGRPYWSSTLWRVTGWSFVPLSPDTIGRRISGHGRAEERA
jgi:hypothetical protein